MNEKNIKLRKVIKITLFIIFIFLVILSAYLIKRRILPFQTDEEKQVKQIYKAAMKGVRSISMAGKFITVFEKENVYKLAELDTLEKIYFSSGRDIEIVEEFAILMKDIKPECKIYHDNEEVVITD